MKRSLAIILVLACAAFTQSFVQARSGKLWSERGKLAAPLAQVPNLRALAEKMRPCVVSISVEQKVNVDHRWRQDFFNDFFRGKIPREYHNRGIGTGFTIRGDGLILTNNHVVEGADVIEVTLLQANGDEKKLKASIVGTAPEYDVALIQTDKNAQTPVCYLGNSEDTHIGDWVLAVGNPFGLSHSISVGIISAKERRHINPSGRSGLYNFLQTDASINPGNSGGPLCNMSGEVIGINTAINAAGSGIGFAIPINMVKSLLPSLKRHGKYVRSWIGIKIQPLSADLAHTYGRKKSTGALVAEVIPGGPASQAGLQEGDVILSFNGKAVRDHSDLPLYASMAGVGIETSITIWRNRGKLNKKITLAAFPEDEVALSGQQSPAKGALGLTVADITPQLQREFRLEQSRGVMIRDIDPGSAAHRAGLRPGDLVLSINGKRVRRAKDFAMVVKKSSSGAHLRLQIQRANGKIFLAMRKP
jgi:serine protease Do